MSSLRARVIDGHLVLKVPTTLPEGTVLNLVVDDEADGLSEEELRQLNRALVEGWADIEAGREVSAIDVIEKLRVKAG